MTKKLVIVAALMSMCSGAFAQDEGSTSGGGVISINTNNKLQVSLLLGNANLFNQDLNYVLPTYSNTASTGIGLPGTSSQSNDPGMYINFNDLGQGNLVNMAGIQFNYFITDYIDANVSFGMDLRSTPKKDYVEGEDFDGMAAQASKYIVGQLKANWLLNIGGNYHFSCSNEKIDIYAGVKFGIQNGRITTYTPYTDKEYDYLTNPNSKNEGDVLYLPRDKAGQVRCFAASIVGGINYTLGEGVFFGLEFAPYAFQSSVLEVIPKGQQVYQCSNIANRFFACPMVKFGFRF